MPKQIYDAVVIGTWPYLHAPITLSALAAGKHVLTDYVHTHVRALDGLNGQHIHINPKAELVIVKLSSHPVGNSIFTHVLDRRAFDAVAKAVQ